MAKDRTGRVNRRELLALGAAVGTAAARKAFLPTTVCLAVARGRYTDALPWIDGSADAPDAAPAGGWRYLNDSRSGS